MANDGTPLFILKRGAIVAGVCALGGTVFAHPRGFHERAAVTVRAEAIEVLLTVDVDSGQPGQRLRYQADVDKNGRLDAGELGALKRSLARRLTDNLKVSLSGYPLHFQQGGVKLETRGNGLASDEGLSLAVLLKTQLSEPPFDGLSLQLSAASPDGSHVGVEVFLDSGSGDGGPAFQKGEVAPEEVFKVRLEGFKR